MFETMYWLLEYPCVAQNKNVNSMCFNVNLQTILLRDKKEALKFEKKVGNRIEDCVVPA